MAKILENPFDDKAPLSPAWWRWEWANVALRQEEVKLRWFRRLIWLTGLFKKRK